MENGEFFLGLKRNVPDIINNVSFYNLDDGLTTSQGITRLRTNNATRINATTAAANFNSYTCLLYTSPSPRDRTRSRMPSSA